MTRPGFNAVRWASAQTPTHSARIIDFTVGPVAVVNGYAACRLTRRNTVELLQLMRCRPDPGTFKTTDKTSTNAHGHGG